VTLITVSLSGSQELPPVQTAGTATANLGINFNTGLMTGTVTFSGLTGNAIAAHFHLAPAGFNGSIDLDALEGGLGGTSGVMNVAAGTILNQNQFDQLISDQYYINVHTTTNTNGEIRGQVIFPPGAATSLTGSRLP
jgi:CHRD domain